MENNFISKLEKLKSELNRISIILDEINEDNFDEKIRLINQITKFIYSQRDNLISVCSEEEKKIINIEFEPLIKHINYKFDNIVGQIKAEQSEISKELNIFQNKKKLANYNR